MIVALAGTCSEIVASNELEQEGCDKLTIRSRIVSGIRAVVDGELDIDVSLEHLVSCLIQHFRELDSGRQQDAIEAGVEWIRPSTAVGIPMGHDHLRKRSYLVETQHMVPIVIND